MTEKALQGEYISAVAQVFDGEGMPEAVRVAIGYIGTLAHGVEQVTDCLWFQWNERIFRLGVALGQVSPDVEAGALPKIDNARP